MSAARWRAAGSTSSWTMYSAVKRRPPSAFSTASARSDIHRLLESVCLTPDKAVDCGILASQLFPHSTATPTVLQLHIWHDTPVFHNKQRLTVILKLRRLSIRSEIPDKCRISDLMLLHSHPLDHLHFCRQACGLFCRVCLVRCIRSGLVSRYLSCWE